MLSIKKSKERQAFRPEWEIEHPWTRNVNYGDATVKRFWRLNDSSCRKLLIKILKETGESFAFYVNYPRHKAVGFIPSLTEKDSCFTERSTWPNRSASLSRPPQA